MGKMPELSSSLVAVKGSGAPAPDATPRTTEPAPARRANMAAAPTAGGEDTSLNFKVSDDFKREFKSYAASQGMKLNEFLRHIYSTYRQQKGN